MSEICKFDYATSTSDVCTGRFFCICRGLPFRKAEILSSDHSSYTSLERMDQLDHGWFGSSSGLPPTISELSIDGCMGYYDTACSCLSCQHLSSHGQRCWHESTHLGALGEIAIAGCVDLVGLSVYLIREFGIRKSSIGYINQHKSGKGLFISKSTGWSLHQYSKRKPDRVRGVYQLCCIATNQHQGGFKIS